MNLIIKFEAVKKTNWIGRENLFIESAIKVKGTCLEVTHDWNMSLPAVHMMCLCQCMIEYPNIM